MNFEPIPWPSKRIAPVPSWEPPAGVRLISGDDHNMEAPNLWVDRMPAKFKDRAPLSWVDEKGGHISLKGRVLDTPGTTADLFAGCKGFFSAEEKIKVMDAERIEASVLFHGKLQALNMLISEDNELYTACIDAYNEWLAEFTRPYAKRLVGVAVLPTFLNPAASRDYMQKIVQLGYKALQMPSFPKGVRYNSMEMEPVWTAIEESGLPLSFHVGAYLEFKGNGATGANIARNLSPFRPLLGQLVFAGVFDRHPNLKVVFTEGGAGWVPHALQDMDKLCRNYEASLKPKLGFLPSYYWQRQCYASFMDDPLGLKLIDYIGEDNVIWSTDYPHAEGVFGYAGEVARNIYETLGPTAGKKVLGGNAARLWKI